MFNLDRFGIYPLTCFDLPEPLPSRQQASSPEVIDSVHSASPEPTELENRRIVNMMCNVKARDDGPGLLVLNHMKLYTFKIHIPSCVTIE